VTDFVPTGRRPCGADAVDDDVVIGGHVSGTRAALRPGTARVAPTPTGGGRAVAGGSDCRPGGTTSVPARSPAPTADAQPNTTSRIENDEQTDGRTDGHRTVT